MFRHSNRTLSLGVLIAGALTPFAFAPFGLFPLAVLGLAVLFFSWREANAARAAWHGFIYGLGLFGVGVSWVYVSLHTYGHMPAPLAVVAVLLFVAGLALFPAAAGAVQARFSDVPAGLRLGLVMPVLWVLFEWLRGWILSGFPWLNVGYSHIDTPLAGFAPWLGVYGVSFAVALTAGLVAAGARDRRRVWRLHLPLVAAIWVGGYLAGLPTWVHPVGSPLHVALIQANVPLTIKWRPQYRSAIINNYVELSQGVARADLYIWPEAAVPGYFDQLAPRLVPRLERLSRERGGADFLIGSVEREPKSSKYYNSVFVVGQSTGVYRKHHLVPFGEFLPLSGLLQWLLDYLHIPMSNFSAGDDGKSIVHVANTAIGVSVCYEDAFGEEIIEALPEARLLVNVSEDSWFGNSLAPHQRLQMARMRAIESARWVLRAANTGPSAVIDPRGDVVVRSPQFMPYVLTTTVQPMEGATGYALYGNTVIVVGLLGVLVGIGSWVFRKRRRGIPADDPGSGDGANRK